MAAYNKFQQFTKDQIDGVHDFDGHTFKIMLTNSSPVNTNTVKANLTEISSGNGYTSGGTSIANVGTASGGTFTLVGTDVTFTASGGSIGPFRYAIVYNDTPTSPADPLICYFDYGSAVTLLDTETITVDFGASLFTQS